MSLKHTIYHVKKTRRKRVYHIFMLYGPLNSDLAFGGYPSDVSIYIPLRLAFDITQSNQSNLSLAFLLPPSFYYISNEENSSRVALSI